MEELSKLIAQLKKTIEDLEKYLKNKKIVIVEEKKKDTYTT